MRKKTKYSKNPVQKLRLKCGMPQAELAGLIGCPRSYLRKIECGKKKISWHLESQLYLLCGVERSNSDGQFYCFQECGKRRPFNKRTFARHIKAAKGATFTLDTVDELLEVMRLAINIASANAKNEYSDLRVHLICAHLIGLISALLRNFDLARDLKKEVPDLAKSNNKQKRKIGAWICSLTGSRPLMTAWYG